MQILDIRLPSLVYYFLISSSLHNCICVNYLRVLSAFLEGEFVLASGRVLGALPIQENLKIILDIKFLRLHS